MNHSAANSKITIASIHHKLLIGLVSEDS
ncbi:MAG: hypothetical protein IPK03_07730 [Bacteroidetes bacterium]|nr:hypothetical protein [Bacteroidota bacterium]